MTTSSSQARIAGLLYLVPMFLGPFSMMYVPSAIVVAGDDAATAANLVASSSLFRLGMVSDAVIVLSELALTAVLYFLLRPVGETLALTATFARLGMTVLQAANLVPQLAAITLVSTAAPTAMSWLRVHDLGVHVWEILFALHCLLVGVLVFRSRFLPRVFGVLMGLASLGYGLNGLGNLVAPGSAPVFAAIVGLTAVIGEVPLVLWLLIKGADEARWQAAHSGTAETA
ncbi:MAG: DUF4386 domain-containing protein [Archangium sp.]|nr:DUF4386 domain-containing protein [Archangium sp.]